MPTPRLRPMPIVALVGRTNVGKSTLWNRLTEQGHAIIDNAPHTTRDRNYAPVLWRGQEFELIDTGGMDVESGEVGEGILKQTRLAARDADILIFVIDGRHGILVADRDIATELRTWKKPVMLIVNKCDNNQIPDPTILRDVWNLGLGEPITVSGNTGRGIGDLLDVIHEEISKQEKKLQNVTPRNAKLKREERKIIEKGTKDLKLVVMGRPNVGKSTIVNAILGEERVITSPIAHTTREPIDTHFIWKDEPVTLIDTAGMRKRAKMERGSIEEESVERNRASLARADIAFLVFDASIDPAQQDKHLAGLLKDATKGLVLVANKWDLVQNKETNTVKTFEDRIRHVFPFLSWAPIIFISAKNHLRTDTLLDVAFRIRAERRREIAYNALQRFLKTVVARKKPLPESGNFSPYVHDVEQTGIEPPSFLITVRGQKQNVHSNWIRYFENRLREKFGFEGTPIVVTAKNIPIGQIPKGEGDPLRPKIRPNRRKRPIGRKGNRY